MSVTDVDKNNLDRGTPQINHDGKLPSETTMSKNTLSTSYRTTSGTSAPNRIQMLNNQISGYNSSNQQILELTPAQFTYSDGNTTRLLMGNHATLGEGFYVSASGQDATTATGNNLIFNSGQDVFKIVKKITSTIPTFSWTSATTASSLLTVAHGLSYTPLVLAYVSGQLVNFSNSTVIASSYIELPIAVQSGTIIGYLFYNNASSTLWPLSIYHGVDSTNVYVQAVLNYGSSTTGNVASIPITLYCLQETAN